MRTEKKDRNNLVVTSVLVITVFLIGIVIGKTDTKASVTAPTNIINAEPNDTNTDFSAFWEIWQMLEKKYPFDEPTSEEKIYAAISGLTEAYGDPYTVFLPPEESDSFNEDISGEFGGVGMEVGIRDEVITVIAPLKGTPAEKAGLQPGDIIYKIENETTAGISIDSAVKKIRGPKGTTVQLSILRKGEFEPIEVSIMRDTIEIPTLKTKTTEEGIFVIELYNFIGNIDSQFKKAMLEFKSSNSDKLILDLRNNPGGFLQSAINTASWFLPLGNVIVKENFGEETSKEKTYRSLGQSREIEKDYQMVILTNEGSASASEIVAGALRPLKNITVLGEKTFGKGSVQELMQLPDGTSLKVTVAKWFTPDGTSLSENGLSPEIQVEMTNSDYQEDKDPQFDKAVEILVNTKQ